MRLSITIIIFFASIIKGFSCECPEYELKELDSLSYRWSDIVVIGRVTKVGSKYKVKIKEVLKGKVESKEITGLSEGQDDVFICTFLPRQNGDYLLYLKGITIEEKSYYYSSDCLGSRSLDMKDSPPSIFTIKQKKAID